MNAQLLPLANKTEGALRVGIAGAGGRMGRAACQTLMNQTDLELTSCLYAPGSAHPLGSISASPDAHAHKTSVLHTDEPNAFFENIDVYVDLTTASAARELGLQAAKKAVHAVIGATGFSDQDIASFKKAFAKSNCLLVPNFSISAVLMMKLAELAAPFFDTAEIIEYHHDQKVDAPSGTAVVTAERIASSGFENNPHCAESETETIPSARGANGAGDIQIHSVRMRGMVAHQKVLFGAQGQTLTIAQDSYDRSSFMPGIIKAIEAVPNLSRFSVGLDQLLTFDS